MNKTAERVTEVAEVVLTSLGAQLQARRVGMSLSQKDMAEAAGVGRMTVVRAEQGTPGTSLSSFSQMALALGLTPRLLSQSTPGDAEQYIPAPEDIVHRGSSFNRTLHGLEGRDRQREKALAKAWLSANKPGDGGTPLLQSLVPGHTQEQATAVATVIQFLGSEGGFKFLKDTLEAAGCQVADPKVLG